MNTSGGGFTFGQPSTQSSQTNPMFSSSLFGGQTSGQSFGFGSQTSQVPQMPNTNTSAFSFGPFTSSVTTSAPTFASTSTPFTFTNPTTTTSQPFNFGSFGPQQSSTSSLFGPRPQQPFNLMGSVSQPQQSQTQLGQMSIASNQSTYNIFAPKIYNDERDEIIAQFNRIQAFWGTGKAFFSQFMPPYDINQSEPLHRFKAICYSEYKKGDTNQSLDNKIGILVKMIGDESQLKTSLLSYEQNFKSIIGSNFVIKIEIIKILPENKAVLSLSVIDPNTNKPCAQLQNYLSQPNIKTQLNNVFMNTFLNFVPLAHISKQELEDYLNNPPKGIDERLWAQAKLENPDPNRFIPVPLVGFAALNERFKLQEKETQQHKMRLKLITDDVSALERHVTETKSKLDECKRKHIALSNRVLKIMISQEVIRKRGYPIQAEEDQLRAKLENIQSELNAPTKFQGCLNELMSQLRQMQSQHQFGVSVSLESSTMNDLKTFLKQEQDGISHLIDILKNDLAQLDSLTSERQSFNS
jgi:nuclear pore complex protein Nup54